MRKVSKRKEEEIKNFRDYFKGKITFMEPDVSFSDGYRVKITKVNDDGSFEGRLLEVLPCM